MKPASSTRAHAHTVSIKRGPPGVAVGGSREVTHIKRKFNAFKNTQMENVGSLYMEKGILGTDLFGTHLRTYGFDGKKATKWRG